MSTVQQPPEPEQTPGSRPASTPRATCSSRRAPRAPRPGFDVAVLALAILTIRVITKRQEAKAQERAEKAAAPLPWAQPAQPAAASEPERPAPPA